MLHGQHPVHDREGPTSQVSGKVRVVFILLQLADSPAEGRPKDGTLML